MLVLTATHTDVYTFWIQKMRNSPSSMRVYISSQPHKLQHFSLIRNTMDLIYSKKGQENLNHIDIIKLAIITTGVIGHSIACFETPLGFYVISKCLVMFYPHESLLQLSFFIQDRLQQVRQRFGILLVQSFLNIGSLKILPLVG